MTGLYTSFHPNGNRHYQGRYNDHQGQSSDGTKDGPWKDYAKDGETVFASSPINEAAEPNGRIPGREETFRRSRQGCRVWSVEKFTLHSTLHLDQSIIQQPDGYLPAPALRGDPDRVGPATGDAPTAGCPFLSAVIVSQQLGLIGRIP